VWAQKKGSDKEVTVRREREEGKSVSAKSGDEDRRELGVKISVAQVRRADERQEF